MGYDNILVVLLLGKDAERQRSNWSTLLFLRSHIKDIISLLFCCVDLLILQLVAFLALQCPSTIPCPTPPLQRYKITFTLFSVMTLYKGNQHPHTETSHLKPTLQLLRGVGRTSWPQMGFPVKLRRRGEGCWCRVAGVSDLFLCGGTDWKLLHTTAASNPAAQLFRTGSMWWGASSAELIGVETNKHKRASTGTGIFCHWVCVCVACGWSSMWEVGAESRPLTTEDVERGVIILSHPFSHSLFLPVCHSSFLFFVFPLTSLLVPRFADLGLGNSFFCHYHWLTNRFSINC